MYDLAVKSDHFSDSHEMISLCLTASRSRSAAYASDISSGQEHTHTLCVGSDERADDQHDVTWKRDEWIR